MLQLITPDRYGEFIDDLAEMHRLRYRLFKEWLGWDVQVSGDMEVRWLPAHLSSAKGGRRSCSGLRASVADDRVHYAS
jgi:acyl homoserine lactone synthase